MGCIPLGYVLIFPLLFSFLFVIVFSPKKEKKKKKPTGLRTRAPNTRHRYLPMSKVYMIFQGKRPLEQFVTKINRRLIDIAHHQAIVVNFLVTDHNDDMNQCK